jgi:hypothetical protein
MSIAQTTPQVTPPQVAQVTNPFDAPLQSEQKAGTPTPVQPQRTQQTQSENPFDVPLASERVKTPAEADAAASQTRQDLVSGLTGMANPSWSDEQKQQFAQGKAAGAVSVPMVASSYLAAHAALSAGVPALVGALTKGTISLGEWATEHPMAAKIIYHGIRSAIMGSAAGAAAKVVGKVIDSAP